jgi:membrane associated rhomboid family serine protease
MYISDVVKNLLILNIIAYIATHLTGDLGEEWLLRLSVYYPGSDYFRPYQIITYMFMHGGFTHIFFNMFALYMFGTPVEMSWGPKKFLFFYLFTGLGALVLQFIVQYVEISQQSVSMEAMNIPMLGASGAVFGILAAYGMQFPNSIIQLIIPPVRMKAKYFVLIYAALEIFLGMRNFMPGVAHFAHVGGALFGFLLIMYWRSRGERLY